MKAGRVGWWLAALCAWVVVQAPTTQASTVRALDLKELVQKADVIAIGVAVSQHPRRRAAGSAIVTDVEFAAEQVLKGWTPPDGSLRITHLGGEVDGVGLNVPGEVGFAPDERALVFLRRGTTPTELRVVGMAQGKLPVTDENGVPMVTTEGHGAVDRNPDGTLTPGEVAVPAPAQLADIVARIQVLLAE